MVSSPPNPLVGNGTHSRPVCAVGPSRPPRPVFIGPAPIRAMFAAREGCNGAGAWGAPQGGRLVCGAFRRDFTETSRCRTATANLRGC